MKKTLAAVAVIVALCAPLASQAFTIRGQPDCGEWVTARQNTQRNTFASLRNETWVIGYMSGIVMGAGEKIAGDPMGKYSNEQIYLYVDNFCRANPLKRAGDAVIELIVNDAVEAGKQKQ
ncbi:hypothetical protein [Cupriavidus sp. BIS7]|uniref:hypothetical protein n=1 Tax=Cupriavidus sp. BIS7 TaxID=1217718 RepID=UPI00037B5735|nr:hypothetical protein [Cupriavidus sp. BIS7]